VHDAGLDPSGDVLSAAALAPSVKPATMTDVRSRDAASAANIASTPATEAARDAFWASAEVDTPSHTTAATAYGRSPASRATVPAAPASSLRVCSIPRSVISATASSWSSSRSGSGRRSPHTVQ
jgi:hypothetical protein